MESQREMAVDAYDGVYIRKHKCTLSLRKGALCAIHIYHVGVGVSSCFCPCFPRYPKTATHRDNKRSNDPYANFF